MFSICEVYITFDKPDAIYSAGEDITGTVYLTPKRPLRCDGVELELFWRTQGRGNRDSGHHDRRHIDPDDSLPRQLEPGRTYEVRFRVPAPPGPLSYHGHLFDVAWFLRAKCDTPERPSLLDPGAKAALYILPKPGVDVSLGPEYEPPPTESTLGRGPRWKRLYSDVFVTACYAGVAALFVYVFTANGYAWNTYEAIWPVLFAGVALWGIFDILNELRYTLVSLLLGEVTLAFDKSELMPGESLRCSVSLRPGVGALSSRFLFTLTAQEKVLRGSYKRPKRYKHALLNERLERSKRSVLSAGERMTVSESFHIPLDAPYSFVANDNALLWQVTVRIVVWGFSLQHRAPLAVLPWREGTSIY